MKPQAKEVPVSIFRRGVLVFIGSPEELMKYLERKYPDYASQLKEDWDRFQGFLDISVSLTIKTTGDPIVYSSKPMTLGELTHELLHATSHILSMVRVEDEETMCYTLEYLLEQIWPWMESLKE